MTTTLPEGWESTTAAPDQIHITRGMLVSGVNFGQRPIGGAGASVAAENQPDQDFSLIALVE